MSDQPTWPSQPTPEQPAQPPANLPAGQPAQQSEGFLPPQYQGAPQGMPPVVGGTPVPQTSGNAIIALVLSIASWIVCPIVLAIVALVFASKADREIAAAPSQLTGGGLTTAAKIVAWVNIGIAAALVLIGIAALVVIAIAGGFR